MPESGIKLLRHEDILSFNEILEVVKIFISNGITKVRLTGGDPLVRKGITDLIKMISSLEGISDLSMTTNGILLEEYAYDLKNAGLNRVNVSLDAIDPDRYRYITRGGDILQVYKGIDAAKAAGLFPIKINCVVSGSIKDKHAIDVKKFCEENDLELRYINQMDLESGKFSIVEGGSGGNCSECNRIRLTSNGDIKPCLFSELGYNIRSMGIEQAVKAAVINKPESGSCNNNGSFYSIGG